MRCKLSKSNYPLLIMAVFAVALVLAGGLLYRWINRASVADREQQVEFLNAAMRSFRGEFDAPLLEIRASFRPAPRTAAPEALDSYLASFYSQWHGNDANGALVSSLSVATIDSGGKLQFRRLDAASGKFQAAALPKSLETFRPRIESIETREPGQVIFYRSNVFSFVVDGSRPMVVVPIAEPEGRRRAPGPWPMEHAAGLPPPLTVFTEREERIREPLPPGGKPHTGTLVRAVFAGPVRGWCFLELNLSYLKERVLPQLVERSFGGAGLSNYQVAVLAGEPQEVIYSSEPGLTASSFASPDGDAVLFASIGEVGAMSRARTRRVQPFAAAMDRMGVFVGDVPPRGPEAAPPEGRRNRFYASAGAWMLVVKNKAGSIDALVAKTRRRNLALGFGVLFLLALSMASLVVSTHRARELARREMEFVAGVSHEFRTPLASIQSAGFNLASGVVRKPSRVQEYGALVQNEARRLTDLIEQVMSYAGIQSGGKHYELVPAQVPAIVERALCDYAPAFRDAGWQIEKNIQENLPLVLAEPSSIESALKNLFANSIKYAGAGRWLRVSAAHVESGGHDEVEISVEDRGPGIDPADLPHIFEPFYRGQGVLASTVPGAGLGLSIVKRHVEAHGGRVSVESTKGSGSRFTLHLPAIAEIQRKAV